MRRVTHVEGCTRTPRPHLAVRSADFILVLFDDPRLGAERGREVVVVADDDDAAFKFSDGIGERSERLSI